jgi:OOP family OmpA-OmpF porin
MRVILFSLFVVSFAQASLEKSDQVVTSVEMPSGSVGAPKGLWPFLGLGAGLTLHDVNGQRDGSPAQVKLLGSYYLTGAVF